MPPAAKPPGGRSPKRPAWSAGAGCLAYLLGWEAIMLAGNVIGRDLGWPYFAAFCLLLLLAGALVQVRQIHRRGQTVPEAFAAGRAERQRRAAMREHARQVTAALRVGGNRLSPADGPGVLTLPGYDVVLDSAGHQKIQVIKQVRKLTGLPLKPAKDLVDSAPATVLRVPDRPTADAAKAVLETAGATVSVVPEGDSPGHH